jgi:serine/threonine protein kinase
VKGTPYGRYELLRKIAAGGMAEVFLARQWAEAGFFRDVVLKRVLPHLLENEQVLKMFQYEAHLLGQLCHPNIPQVSELGRAGGTWYIAMEYVEGHNVADLWRAGARARHVMPLPVALGIVMQTCEALHHAHDRHDRAGRHLRIVHRDVTPHNVMITRDGVVKLMDFGVAQTAARKDTDVGVVKGTFSYMAPEQVRGQVLDRRADVFALGVILYELTTGTRLYRGSDVQVMTSIVEQDAPLPSARVPGYPADLETIVMRALERDRRDRFRSAAELAHQIESFAMRNGMLIGPRTVSDYFNLVFPAQRVYEEDLGLVPEADDEEQGEGAPTAEHAPLNDPAEKEGVLQDLEKLSRPLVETASQPEAAQSPEEPAADAPHDPHDPEASRIRRGSASEDENGAEGDYVQGLARRLEVDGEDK